MKTSTRIASALALLAAAFIAALVAWLYWPQWFGPTAENARWTVLETPEDAVRYEHGSRAEFGELFKQPLKPGMQLHHGVFVRNPGPGVLRLQAPDGDIRVHQGDPRTSYFLSWAPPTPAERWSRLRSAVAGLASAAPAPLPFWQGVVSPGPLALLVLMALGLTGARSRPSWAVKTERIRRGLFGLVAVWAIGIFVLVNLGQLLAGISIYASILSPNIPAPRDRWATWVAVFTPLCNIVFTLGVVSLAVLSYSFIKGGSAQLSSKRWPWWIAGCGMAVLVLLGLAAPLLPWVDKFSNTYNSLRQFERFATDGAGLLIWPLLWLMFERALVAAPSELETGRSSWGRRPAAAMGITLTLALVFAQGLRDGELLPELPRRTSEEAAASEARAIENAQKLACGATHAIVGVPQDFQVVREPACWQHRDGLYQPVPGVLQHCEALQFRVVVQKQYRPLPSASAVESSRTFRLSGAARPVEDLKKTVLWGNDALASNAPNYESVAVKPRVFYGRMESDGILHNTQRGQMVSEDAPGDAETPGYVHVCGWVQQAQRPGLDSSANSKLQLEQAPQSAPTRDTVEVSQKTNPMTNAEIQDKYNKYVVANGIKEYKASHILVASESDAKAIIAAIQKGAKFEAIAKKQSKDPGSGPNGGDLGWADPSSYVSEFSAALVKLEKGKITETPIRSQFGYHVIRLDDVR